jgi:hypothetical protein
MEEEDNNVMEFQDMENYHGTSDKKFSFEQLIMIALKKCLDAGSVEMRSGYFNTKVDKLGNPIRVYIEDSRHKFIECVKSAKAIMTSEIDEVAKKKIDVIVEELKALYDDLCKQEKKDLEIAPPILNRMRISKGIYYKPNCLNKNFSYYQEYMEESVNYYREILEELVRVAKENYQEEEWTN